MSAAPALLFLNLLSGQAAAEPASPPQITSTTISAQMVVGWTTAEPTTGRVEYGTTTAFGWEAASSTTALSHSVVLDLGRSERTIHYRIVAVSSSGAVAPQGPYTAQWSGERPAAAAAASAPRLNPRLTWTSEGVAFLDWGIDHGVRPRDVYQLRSPTGRLGRSLEVTIVADKQSRARLFVPWEDRLSGKSARAQAGDDAIYVGRRPRLTWGVLGGLMLHNDREQGDGGIGAGILLSWNFINSWSVETLAGAFSERSRKTARNLTHELADDRSLTYIAPTWIKKKFWTMTSFSPFLSAGLAPYTARTKISGTRLNVTGPDHNFENPQSHNGVAPMIGAGFDLAFNQRVSVRIDARYITGGGLPSGGGRPASSMLLSFGLLSLL